MSFSIPLFELNFDEREAQAVYDTVASGWISMGGRVLELERKFAERLGAKHVVAVSSCTSALHLALLAAGVGPRHEVIVPSMTFVATVNAVRYTGARPVFADITSAENPTIDPESVRRLITSATKAIVPMHYAGFPARVDLLTAAARELGLAIIEDAAHTPDVSYLGRKLGTWGAAGCFSFFSNKVMTSAEGGLLVTDDDAIAERARLMRSHGMTSLSYDRARGHAADYDVVALGYNYRMDDIRGALALAQLEKLDGSLAARAAIRQVYLRELSAVDEITIPFRDYAGQSANYIFPIVLKSGGPDRRAEVRRRMAEAGIQTSVHYPAAHRFAIYREDAVHLPQTEHFADHEITLPMFDSLTEAQVKQVVGALKQSIPREESRISNLEPRTSDCGSRIPDSRFKIPYDIVYRCDSNPAIGMGHLKRGLDIAGSIRRRAPELRIAICGEFSESAQSFITRFTPEGISVMPVAEAPAGILGIMDTMFDVEDESKIDEAQCRSFRTRCRALVLIQGALELDVPDSVDAVIDHLPGASLRGRPGIRTYLGFDYAPAAAWVDRARHGIPENARTLLAIVGGNTIQHGPAVILDGLDALLSTGAEAIVLVVSPLYPVERLRALPIDRRVTVVRNVPDLAPYYDQASAVVCSYGNATYESLSLHRPTITINYKPFQDRYAEYLAAKGLVVNVGCFDRPNWPRLNDAVKADALPQLSRNAARVFQSSGIENITRVLLNEYEHVSH
jgi:dTDP-4-amino-4,6-dideoxygalactose transaminase/spore coat polysaccharide biosynthesis predicted glycosyltransferase SpsG